MDLNPGDGNGRAAAFTSLGAVLGDMCNGWELPPYFRSRKNPDDPKRSIDGAETWLTRANAAGIMDRLMAGGMNRTDAAKEVSRRVINAGIKCGKDTVAEWRRQLMEGDIAKANGSPPAFAIKRYRQLAASDSLLGKPPRTEAGRRKLLEFFSRELAH